MEGLEKFTGSSKVNPDIYQEVFSGELDPMGLEEIYVRFNREGHPLHRGHSMSVSDVVVIDPDSVPFLVGEISGSYPSGTHFTAKYTDLIEYNLAIESLRAEGAEFEAHDMVGMKIPSAETGAFFCDSFGFKKIDFDESLTHKPENLLRIVYVEPHKEPFVAEVQDDLKMLQKAVGGRIEPIYPGDGAVVVGNEEAKLLGLEGNRHFYDDILTGPFFVCGDAGESFRSLTDEEVTTYMTLFEEPEDISQEEVQSTMGYAIFGFQEGGT
jgi:hypothetical protein